MIGTWPCPLPDGRVSDELSVSFKAGRDSLVLIIPPLFDEHNKMRRQLVEVMRRLSAANHDAVLPDLPGWNESLEPLADQTLDHWRKAISEAARFFNATHVLTVRSGSLLSPPVLRGWQYAPHSGAKLVRGMIRARLIANREAGREETSDQLHETGRSEGLTLAGWTLGAELFRELECAQPIQSDLQSEISQDMIGGTSPWLRAEPDEDSKQADALATLIAEELATP